MNEDNGNQGVILTDKERKAAAPWFTVPLILLTVVQSVVLWLFGAVMPDHGGDLALYYRTSTALLHGQMPYRDFPLEYPPFALAAYLPPHLMAIGRPLGFDRYCDLFLVENVLLAARVLVLLQGIRSRWQGSGRPGSASLRTCTGMILLLGPLLPWRYDLFPTVLTVLAVYAVITKHPGWAGVWIGAAIAAKLYPVVLVPVFCLSYFAGRQFRAMGTLLMGMVAAVAVTFLPFLTLPPAETASFIRYNLLRGLQLESVSSGIILLAHDLGLTEVHTVFNYGAVHIDSPWSEAFLRCLPVLFLVSSAAVLWLCFRRFRDEQVGSGGVSSGSLIAGCLAMLLIFVAENKVFSPQYVIWLLPFFALLPAGQRRLGVAICLMTILIFPFDYGELMQMYLPSVILLNLRNLAVIALAIWLAVGLFAGHSSDSVVTGETDVSEEARSQPVQSPT